MAKYINPYTDFGFKKLFGEEANKDLTPEQRDEYEQSRLSYLEVQEVANTAEMDTRKKVAKEMKKAGEPKEKIKLYTGLNDDEIDKL